MLFNVHAYYAQKLHVPNYLTAHGVLDSLMWQYTSNRFGVTNKTNFSPFIGIFVGCVTPFCLRCGPAGNHINKNVSLLNKAKYQLHLTCPVDHEFSAYYQAAIAVLDTLENQVATSYEFKNMISKDMSGKMIQMVRNVFEKQVRIFILCFYELTFNRSP
jgi:hypothetical protein